MGAIRPAPLTKLGFRRDVRLFLACLAGLLVFIIVALLLVLARTAGFAAESATREQLAAADAAADSFQTPVSPSEVESKLIYLRSRFNIGAMEFRPQAGRVIASGGTAEMTPVSRKVPGGTLISWFDQSRLQSAQRVFVLMGTIGVAATLAAIALLVLYLPRITRPVELLLDKAGEVSERGDDEDEASYLVDTFRRSIDVLKAQEIELRHLHALQKSRADDLERVTAALTRSLTSGFLAVDRNGNVVDMNSAAHEIIRPSAPDVQGRSVSAAFGENEFTRLLDDALARRAALTRTEAEITIDGEKRLIGLTTVPLLNEEQQFLGMLALFTDLTPIRELEGRVRESKNLADLGEITAGIAHEFRNSLSTILGYLRLSKRAATPTQTIDGIDKAEREATSLSSAVDGLLSFARPMEIERHPVDLLELTCGIAERLRATSGVDIRCEGDPATVDGDAVLLERAVENVIRNSVDSVKRKNQGGTVEVRVVSAPHPSIVIKDDGVGVDPMEVPSLFLPFRTSNPGGHGLGLPLAKKIVLLHDGTIRLTGKPGAGAVATIEFAAAPRAEEQPARSA